MAPLVRGHAGHGLACAEMGLMGRMGLIGAGDRIRTGDHLLGRQELYH